MSKTPPVTLVLSGRVFDNRLWGLFQVGDIFVSPGAKRTGYIDASVFDGHDWRALSLSTFGGISRRFEHAEEIGPLMRAIAGHLQGYAGMPVHYERPVSRQKSSYIFRGVPFRAPW